MGTSFAERFAAGQQIAKSLLDTYDKAKTQKAFSDIVEAKPEESTGFTAEQGDQLRAAAESGQYDIGYDEAMKAYTATPKSDPSQTGVLAQQGVTDFMGQRTVGSMDPSQVNSARERAMAGVIMKSDPIQGMRMMRDVTNGERDNERYGWEKGRSEREARLAGEQDAEKQFGKTLDSQVGEWFKKRLTGEDGTQRAATVDDHLAASQYRAAQLTQAGRMDQAGQVMKDHAAQSLVKIQLESAQREQALGKTASALAAGDLNAVKDFYNTFVPDGARVVNVSRSDDGRVTIQRESMDGRPMPDTVMKDAGQLMAALASFKDPMAVYNWSQNEFKNTLAVNADKRADKSLAIQGETAVAARDARITARAEVEAKAKAAMAIYQENNPGATPAQLEAVRTGVMAAIPGAGDKNDPSDVKLARSALAAKVPGVTDMASALLWARNKSTKPAGEMHAEFVASSLKNYGSPADAVKKADEVMGNMGYVKSGGTWSLQGGQGSGGSAREASGKISIQAPVKINSPSELEKLAKGDRYTAPDGTVRIKQ